MAYAETQTQPYSTAPIVTLSHPYGRSFVFITGGSGSRLPGGAVAVARLLAERRTSDDYHNESQTSLSHRLTDESSNK